LEDLGFRVDDAQVQDLFTRFKELADKKKFVYDEDIEAMAEERLELSRETYQLSYLHTSAGTSSIPTATLKLRKGETEIQEAATGDGPVDAVFNAIDRATGLKVRVANYAIKALTQGRDAQGEVTLTLSIHKDEEVHGRGVSTDIIEASAKAYLNGVNKLLMKHERKNAQAAFKALKGI
jgi:2-isopropylmalate synthase